MTENESNLKNLWRNDTLILYLSAICQITIEDVKNRGEILSWSDISTCFTADDKTTIRLLTILSLIKKRKTEKKIYY